MLPAYSPDGYQIIFTILSADIGLNAAWVGRGCFMIYRGVEFSVTAVAAGAWKWQFRIGDRLVTGKTETRLHLLAVKRVQMRIDRELKKAAAE